MDRLLLKDYRNNTVEKGQSFQRMSLGITRHPHLKGKNLDKDLTFFTTQNKSKNAKL